MNLFQITLLNTSTRVREAVPEAVYQAEQRRIRDL